MTALGRVMVVAALAVLGCKHDGEAVRNAGSAAPSARAAVATTSPAIDRLLAGIPGTAVGLAFLDLDTPPWTLVTGGAGLPLDAATRKQLDAELRAYVKRYAGVDVSKLQYAVGFIAGPPPGGAIVVQAVAGTPALAGATDYAGGKVWVLDPTDRISLGLKGDLLVLGDDTSVYGVLDTLAGTRASVVTANRGLVDWLHAQCAGAALGVAAVVPAALPVPPPFAGLQRVAFAIGRTQLRAVVEGEDAAITALKALADNAIATVLAEVDRAHDAAIAGTLPPLQGAFAIIGAAYATSYAAKLAPRREGNRLIAALDVATPGTDAATVAGAVGILAAVAIPAFMDYTKKAKQPEAELQLNRLATSLRIQHASTGSFPKGDTALTPAASCCSTGGACPADPRAWQHKLWQDLDFEITDEHLYQYRYRSDGKTAVVEAVGDMDCDGTTITYRLDVAAPKGEVTTTITPPQPNSD